MSWYLDIVRQAWAQIRAYALRSTLTALGIVIAVTGVIAIACVMQALESGVNRELSKLGAANVMVGTNWKKLMSGKPVSSMSRRDWAALRSHVPGISAVVATARVDAAGKVRYGQNGLALSVLAASDQLPSLYRLYPELGRFLADSDENAHLRVCVISSDIVKRLGLPANPIGARLQIGRLQLQIIGVMPGEGRGGSDLSQIGEVYIPFSVAEDITGKESELHFGFRVLAPEQHAQVLERVRQVLRQSQQTVTADDDNFVVEDAAAVRKANDVIIGLISLVLLAIVSIALLVGGIGIMNVMLVSVTERTSEIGILRALGATRQQIRVQFLVEAAILSGLGALAGVLCGALLAAVIVSFIPHAEGAQLPLWAVFTSVGVAVVVGLISGALPAARAADLNPVAALAKE